MSEVKVNKLSPRSGTTVTLGDSGDTITLPAGVTLANSGTFTNFQSTGIDDNAASTAITIDSGQRVRINNTTSTGHGTTYNLIVGNESSGGDSGILITAPNNENSYVSFGDSDGVPGLINYNHASNFLRTYVNGSERMRIDSSGNVGIGTSNPTGKLNIATASTDGVNTLFGANTSPTAAGMYVGFNDSDATATLGVYYASSPYPVINITRSNRNVGIGTTSPVSKLHIKDGEPTVENTTSLGSETVNFVYSNAGGASGLTITLATLSSPTTAAFAHAKIDWGSIYATNTDNGGAVSEVLWLKYKTDGTYATKEATLGSVGDNISANFYWDNNVLKVDIPVYNSINANITITYTKFGSITVNV